MATKLEKLLRNSQGIRVDRLSKGIPTRQTYINQMKSVIFPNMKIQITDLSRKITEEELTKFFTAYGKVSSVTIVMDKITGNSKGFGFVEMADEKEARNAIRKLHKTTIDGKKVTVKQARA